MSFRRLDSEAAVIGSDSTMYEDSLDSYHGGQRQISDHRPGEIPTKL